MIRRHIEDLNAVKVRPTGGVYFVQRRYQPALNALRELVKRLRPGPEAVRPLTVRGSIGGGTWRMMAHSGGGWRSECAHQNGIRLPLGRLPVTGSCRSVVIARECARGARPSAALVVPGTRLIQVVAQRHRRHQTLTEYDMALIRLYGRRAAIRRCPGGHTILICAVVFLLCPIGLVGCSGSSGGSDGYGAPPPPSSPSSSCVQSSSVHPGHKSHTPKLPVLVSARNPTYIPIPEPDINVFEPRPAGEDPLTQPEWAGQEVLRGESNPIQLPDQGGHLELTPEQLQLESNAVAFREEYALVSDDQNSGDRYYGIRICLTISGILSIFDTLDNVNQVVDNLNSLASSYRQQSPNDLANIVLDATQQFQNTFGGCIDDLQVARWILEVIRNWFCPLQDQGNQG